MNFDSLRKLFAENAEYVIDGTNDEDCDIDLPTFDDNKSEIVEETPDYFKDYKQHISDIIEVEKNLTELYKTPDERYGPIFSRLPDSLKTKLILAIHDYKIKEQPRIIKVVDRNSNFSYYIIERKHYNISFENYLVNEFLPENNYFDEYLEFLVLKFDREINYVETAKLKYDCLIGCESTIITEISETNPFPKYSHYTLYL